MSDARARQLALPESGQDVWRLVWAPGPRFCSGVSDCPENRSGALPMASAWLAGRVDFRRPAHVHGARAMTGRESPKEPRMERIPGAGRCLGPPAST
jgi:hypothetical protein